jgi:hypothetical protein
LRTNSEAIQRFLGAIPVKNKNIIYSDILASEQMVEAILFFDKIVCFDDYKLEFSSSRNKYFTEIRFIDPAIFDYDFFVKEARVISSLHLLNRNSQI